MAGHHPWSQITHKIDALPDADKRRQRAKRDLDEAIVSQYGEAFEDRYLAYRTGCCLYVEEIGAGCPITARPAWADISTPDAR